MSQRWCLPSSLRRLKGKCTPGHLCLCFAFVFLEDAEFVHSCVVRGMWPRGARVRPEVDQSSVEHKLQTRGCRSRASQNKRAQPWTVLPCTILRCHNDILEAILVCSDVTRVVQWVWMPRLRSHREAVADVVEKRRLTQSQVTFWATSLLSKAKGKAFAHARRNIRGNNSSSKLG